MRVIGFFVRLIEIGLVLLVLMVVVRTCSGVRVIKDGEPAYDPAIETELQGRSKDFSQLDRWAYPGMELPVLTVRLQREGYDCPLSQDRDVGGTPRRGVYPQICTLQSNWPVPRRLVVEATVLYARGIARVTMLKARAERTSLNPALQAWGTLLQRLDLIESEEMPITGLHFADSAGLARWVADGAASQSWQRTCGQLPWPEYPCSSLHKQRHAEGLPPLPVTPIKADLQHLIWNLAAMGLEPEHGFSTDKPVAVRMDAQGGMWIDATGPDFTGAARQVSVLVDPDGARPQKLLIHQGESAPFSIAVEGMAHSGNSEDPYWLLPMKTEFFTGKYNPALRVAQWVIVPPPSRQDWLEQLAERLPSLDPHYLAVVLRRLIAHAQGQQSAEQVLGLYPELQQIDQIAEILRRAQIPRRLTEAGPAAPDVASWYPDEPRVRAAWALARCETYTGQPEHAQWTLDETCWLMAAAADLPLNALLRRELLKIRPMAASLSADHPVSQRLARIQQALELQP